MKKDEKNNEAGSLKVEWFGADGALVLLFIVLACIYGYGLINRVDFIVGVMAPFIAFSITAGVFIKYCTEVFAFASGKKGDVKKEEE